MVKTVMPEQENRTALPADDSLNGRGLWRELTLPRRIYYFLGTPVLRAVFALLSATYRVEKRIGEDIADRIINDPETVYAPCYWHQHHVLCSRLIHDWTDKGFKACFLVSASVDGEAPARIARAWGAEVIRGSANRTGALALRDMQQMMKSGYSIVTTADGPNGPQHEFKPGAVLMARIGGTPMVPLACAADRAWYLNRWDRFMIPKPFARVVLAVGDPVDIPRNTPMEQLGKYGLQMQQAINALTETSEKALRQNEGQ